MASQRPHSREPELTRRQLLKITLTSSALATSGIALANWAKHPPLQASTFIGKADSHESGIDGVVSKAKLKTHHWAGVTLSMKTLFSTLPDLYHGWPQNVLHHADIHESILDIIVSLRPHFVIVEEIIGMKSAGMIMRTSRSVDRTIMEDSRPVGNAPNTGPLGIHLHATTHLTDTSHYLGSIQKGHARQRKESISAYKHYFALHENTTAHHGMRLQ